MSAGPISDIDVVELAAALRRAARATRDGFRFEGDPARGGATIQKVDPDGPTFWEACDALQQLELLADVAITSHAEAGEYDEALLLAWTFRHAIEDGKYPDDHFARSERSWRDPEGIRLARVCRTIGFKGGDLTAGAWVLVLARRCCPEPCDQPELTIRAFGRGVSCDSIVYECDVEFVR